MKAFAPLAGLVAIVVVLWVAAENAPTEIWCDGAYPVWMLEAQDYDGGGCVEILPPWRAPPIADWREYCVGLCDPADYPANQEYHFGP